jgi:FlaG/FlaF family flagellin (archaellin)
MLYWNGSSWVHVAPGITGQTLTFCYNAPQWGPCLPQVTTLPVTNITGYTAASGVNIIANGGNPVTAAGICWSINPNPSLNDSVNPNGSVSGTTNLNLTNLSPGTTYYIRAFATNGGGTAYGNQLTFVTGAALPTLTTINATNITFNSAILGGNVTNDGGAPVTAHGVCWSTTQNPTLANNNLIIGSGLGAFNDTITGLSGNTTYYVRAFATNSSGTAYGNQVSFNLNSPAGLSCNYCGPAGGQDLTSPLMVNGVIYAVVNQQISMDSYKCALSQYMSCANSGFNNPPQTTVHSYTCTNAGSNSINQVISFSQPGIYSVTGFAGSSVQQKVCTVSIVVN